jgi:hypothetical protein
LVGGFRTLFFRDAPMFRVVSAPGEIGGALVVRFGGNAHPEPVSS